MSTSVLILIDLTCMLNGMLPCLDIDLYARRQLDQPLPAYAAIRARGPAVWMPRHRIWAIGRYADVRLALRTPEVFASGKGVGVNPLTNRLSRGTVLNSDGDDHARRRSVMMRSLGPRNLDDLEAVIEARAEQIVAALLERPSFDGVHDFAAALPVEIVARLVGLRTEAAQLLRWGAATFNALGPANLRAARAVPAGLSMLISTRRLSEQDVLPGSWAASVFAAADRGEISRAEAKSMIIDFVTPSLDTTIFAASAMLHLLGTHPLVWDEIRAAPELIPGAVAEAVRLASPLKAFTRHVTTDTEVDGVPIPAGDRVLLIFASANRDETRFPHPNVFDVRRKAGRQLGWGFGPHACAGMGLAKLEMQSLVRAMTAQVTTIGVGTPVTVRNNTLQGFAALPATMS